MASIAKRDDGRWRARYRDEAGREHARHFDRKIDVKRWLDGVTASVVRGEYVDPAAGAVTFAHFYGEWSARQVWAPRTLEAMNLAAGSVPFADLPLRNLRRSHVESWVKAMTARGLAPGTVHTRVQNVRSVLRGAVADRLISRDPSEGVTLPRRRRAEAAMRLPTPQRWARSWRPLTSRSAPSWACARSLVCDSGRLPSCRWVMWTSSAARCVCVDRCSGWEAGRSTCGCPSQAPSARCPSRPPWSICWPASAPERVGCSHGSVVMGRSPRTWSITAGGRRWDRAGVTGVRLHDLRHFYASGLIAAGCDVVTVQRALGHASATTTLGTYSHLWPTAEDRTRKAAEGLFTDSCGLDADSEKETGD